jgi:ureidoglycolate lyase
MELRLEPLSADAFAPFGRVLEIPRMPGRLNADDALTSLRDNAKPQLALIQLEPTAAPFTVTEVERHAFSSQIFVPIEVSRYVLLVATNNGAPRPEPHELRGFVAGPAQAISYHPNVWHHRMTVLDSAARFAAMLWVDKSADDEEFVDLACAVTVLAPERKVGS